MFLYPYPIVQKKKKVYHEPNTNRKEYQEILKATQDVIKNCKTDLEKAKAIYEDWQKVLNDYSCTEEEMEKYLDNFYLNGHLC